ncbi:hypothetical protein Pint_27451 [Pistacia integerrima]|uniref:Uncharacterized protein n=1 Tax=Pistacia integerrima TaxID=434235 RepID=A0ACC0YRN6_9ROSI|nr:hypothetical protein Pint_27451 [Pistacia integerrima]
MSQPEIKRRVGKFELGRTIGEGTFAKVKFARNSETGEPVALNILDKEKVLRHKMVEQIKQDIYTMKLIRHPNVVQLYEVIGSKTKIIVCCDLEVDINGEETFIVKKRGGARVSSTDFCSFPLATIVITIFTRSFEKD